MEGKLITKTRTGREGTKGRGTGTITSKGFSSVCSVAALALQFSACGSGQADGKAFKGEFPESTDQFY